jgi:hypothetical protein
MNNALFTKTDSDTNMQVNVYNHAKGFSVVLKDMDANEYVPVVKIYPTIEGAIAYAETL